ncbi:MAG: endonuclease VIII [Xanthomonadales bacterium]|nr:endonuclease VIII [Xanthomonadales bacterium]
MPEGPEVKRDAARLDKVLSGHVAEQIQFGLPELQGPETELTGRTIGEVAARGKALLLHFEGGLSVYTHNQLYGRWFIKAAGERPKTGRQLRFRVETSTHAALLYSASEIEVWPTDQLDEQPYLARLGPDPLNGEVSVAELADYMATDPYRGRQLAGSLLDQGFVAGVGNYLRSDILFYAAIHPRARPKDLTPEQLHQLADSCIRIMRRAYRTRGVTNDAERVETLKAEGVRRRDYRHLAYGRDGEECYRCGETMVREDLGSRAIFFCPACQVGGRNS